MIIMKSRTDPSTLVRLWLRAAWRSLLLLVVGGLLGATVAGGGLSAQSGKAGSTASMADAAGSHASKATSSSSVPVPAIDKLREQAISRIQPVVVEVTNVGKGLGSGVILTKDGYIVTNNHVVAGASKIQVTLSNGKTVPATLRGYDPVDDLAVIKIRYGNTLPTVAFGNSDDLKVGEEVLADGNPLGIIQTVTNGIVSALHRVVAEGQNSNGRIYNAVQTSAPINPGNSGGALINLAGQLVGIPTLTAVDPEFNAPAAGVGFAIPSNRVYDITSQIIKYGKVQHSGIAALGIGARNVTPLIAQQLNLPVDRGVVILGFAHNSPAQKAGLTKGDVIVTVDNNDITSFDDLLSGLATKKPGQTVKVTAVDPNGHKHTYTVKLNELDVYAGS
jgi:S1-C subfamily serine protease